MSTRMIEVALGLALVFAITSLLLTAVRERWSSAWGSRGRILMQALASFVGDDPDFAKKLMQHPLLLSLSKETAGGTPRPSYMGADIVVTSLIASLVERCPGGARPPSPTEFVQALKKMAEAGAPEAPAKAGDCDRLDDPQVRSFCTRLNEINGLKNVGLPMGWNPRRAQRARRELRRPRRVGGRSGLRLEAHRQCRAGGHRLARDRRGGEPGRAVLVRRAGQAGQPARLRPAAIGAGPQRHRGDAAGWHHDVAGEHRTCCYTAPTLPVIGSTMPVM